MEEVANASSAPSGAWKTGLVLAKFGRQGENKSIASRRESPWQASLSKTRPPIPTKLTWRLDLENAHGAKENTDLQPLGWIEGGTHSLR